jgi:hypothetical protein
MNGENGRERWSLDEDRDELGSENGDLSADGRHGAALRKNGAFRGG